MSGERSKEGAAQPVLSNRNNRFFLPRDGIDREVITSDICRYLGNDALVRPGVLEKPDGVVNCDLSLSPSPSPSLSFLHDLTTLVPSALVIPLYTTNLVVNLPFPFQPRFLMVISLLLTET